MSFRNSLGRSSAAWLYRGWSRSKLVEGSVGKSLDGTVTGIVMVVVALAHYRSVKKVRCRRRARLDSLVI